MAYKAPMAGLSPASPALLSVIFALLRILRPHGFSVFLQQAGSLHLLLFLSLSGMLSLSSQLLLSHHEHLRPNMSSSIRPSLTHPVSYAIVVCLFPICPTKTEPSLHRRTLLALNTAVSQASRILVASH